MNITSAPPLRAPHIPARKIRILRRPSRLRLSQGVQVRISTTKASNIYEKGHFRSRKIHSPSHRGNGRSQGLRVDLEASKVVRRKLKVRFPIVLTPSVLTMHRVVVPVNLASCLFSSSILSSKFTEFGGNIEAKRGD